ncbi:STAS domain-containing protein [Pseudonocardia sp.]|uniref:STAS domain-containing protein n=1 Tax=Pseudonocardia sp. TaxID=60912 RepID=UPI00260AF2BE|nr:STAS domain-containing protein [Pseudonocardia sp.]
MSLRTDSLAHVEIIAATASSPAVCSVRGEIDISNVDTLRAALAEAFRRWPSLVVDLGEVTFFASAGIRALLDARTGHADRTMTIVTGRAVETILRICGMASVASCHPDRESAAHACLAQARATRRP